MGNNHMEVYHGYTSDHRSYHAHNAICWYHTQQPLDHFLRPHGKPIKLILYGQDAMFIEKSNATTIALITVCHADMLPLEAYARSLQSDIEDEMLPEVCNSQSIRSVLYLPLGHPAPVAYELTAARTGVTVFGTPLTHDMSEWTRRFSMLPSGSLINDSDVNLDIQLPSIDHPICHPQVLERALNTYFPS